MRRPRLHPSVTPVRADRRWLLWLGVLAVVRAAIPLLALSFGGALPGFPDYSYRGPRGDASGYIDTARAIISAGAGLRLLLPVLLLVAVAGLLALRWAWRRYPGERHWVIAAAAALVFCIAAAVILQIGAQAPAGAVGWPLLLSIPLLPFRVIGWIDDYNTQAPHSALGMRSPAEYRAGVTLSSSR